MSHLRTLVVIGGVVLSFLGLFCLGWVLSSPWKIENISLRGMPNPPRAEFDQRLAAAPEFPLQPASVTPFPDQPRTSVLRQPPRVEPNQCELKLQNPRLSLHGTPAERLEQLLEQPVTMKVTNATVGEIAAMLRAALSANVLVDTKALEEAAYDKESLLNGSSPTPVKLRQALDSLLADAQLDFLCDNDSLVVTTIAAAENFPITKIYEVGDLLRPAGKEHEQDAVDYDTLIKLIVMNVMPTTWKSSTGPTPGLNLYEPADLLVIEQSRRGHEEITKLLAELRRGRGLKIPDTLKIAGPAVNLAQQQAPPISADAAQEPASDPEARILRFEFTDEGLSADLLKKMKPAERLEYQLRRRALLQLQNVTIRDLVKILGDKLQINVLLDRKAFEESAFDTATPFNYLPNAGTRLSASLRQLLLYHNLNYYVDEESLILTSTSAEEAKQFVRYYTVADLIRPVGSSPKTFQADFDPLIRLIESTIQPTTWKSNGGQGDLAPQETLDLLIVSNTCQVQEQLDELISQLRKIHASKAETVQANEATLQRVVYQLVLPREETKKDILDKDGNVTARETQQGELQYSLDDLIDLIKKNIEPASWTDDKHRIDALGESLIVTHSQAAQRKLNELLHDLGITAAQHQPLQQHGYGGAFGGGGGFGGAQNTGNPVGRPVGPQPANNGGPATAPNGPQNSGGLF